MVPQRDSSFCKDRRILFALLGIAVMGSLSMQRSSEVVTFLETSSSLQPFTAPEVLADDEGETAAARKLALRLSAAPEQISVSSDAQPLGTLAPITAPPVTAQVG